MRQSTPMHTDHHNPNGELDGLTAPDTIADDELAGLALKAGLLSAGQPRTPELRAYADLIADRCAALVDDYTMRDINAGEEIRAAFSLG